MDIPKIKLLDQEHAVTLPDFATREELFVAYGETLNKKGVAKLRAYSATLGLCTRIGRHSGADYAKHRFDVLSYGGEVYSWLRGQGVSVGQLGEAALPILEALQKSLYPSEDEVRAEVGNSKGGAAG